MLLKMEESQDIIEELKKVKAKKEKSKKNNNENIKEDVKNNDSKLNADDENKKSESDTEKKLETKLSEINTDVIKDEKVSKILKKAKEKGSITYGDLASELDDVNPDQIDKVFDAFEELGVNLLSDDLDEEPDIEDLKEVEDLKLDEILDTNYEGISVDDPVRMYLREIGRIQLLTFDDELVS